MRRAKSAGFDVAFYFVSTTNAAINVDRVGNRVRLGGHDVPESKIVERYHRTMSMLPDAIRAADRAFIFDNSALQISAATGLRLVAVIRKGEEGFLVRTISPVPDWVADAVDAL